jgi:hypothetical protein
MLSPRQAAVSLIVIWASAAFAQPAVDTEDATSAAGEDEVDALVRELRESRRPAADRSIGVYSTHYTIGQRRFDSLEDLLEYIKDYAPDRFSMVSLKECDALARAGELLAEKAKLDHAYIRRLQEAGRSAIYHAGISSPRECPLDLSGQAREAARAAEQRSQ